MWCWGRDIRHPAVNALGRYDFVPHRPPDPDRGSTAYLLSGRPGLCVMLWGFGLFYGDTERSGLFLKRYEFVPRLTPTVAPPMTAWALEQLPTLPDAHAPEEWTHLQYLFIAALRWIASYEQWAALTLGMEYRRRCLDGWSKVVVPAEAMAATWRQLAAGQQTNSAKPEPHRGRENGV
jgi:hypothetical protein